MAAILQAIQNQQQQLEFLKHNMSAQQENYLEVNQNLQYNLYRATPLWKTHVGC
jgi:hypothetical protein